MNVSFFAIWKLPWHSHPKEKYSFVVAIIFKTNQYIGNVIQSKQNVKERWWWSIKHETGSSRLYLYPCRDIIFRDNNLDDQLTNLDSVMVISQTSHPYRGTADDATGRQGNKEKRGISIEFWCNLSKLLIGKIHFYFYFPILPCLPTSINFRVSSKNEINYHTRNLSVFYYYLFQHRIPILLQSINHPHPHIAKYIDRVLWQSLEAWLYTTEALLVWCICKRY